MSRPPLLRQCRARSADMPPHSAPISTIRPASARLSASRIRSENSETEWISRPDITELPFPAAPSLIRGAGGSVAGRALRVLAYPSTERGLDSGDFCHEISQPLGGIQPADLARIR